MCHPLCVIYLPEFRVSFISLLNISVSPACNITIHWTLKHGEKPLKQKSLPGNTKRLFFSLKLNDDFDWPVLGFCSTGSCSFPTDYLPSGSGVSRNISGATVIYRLFVKCMDYILDDTSIYWKWQKGLTIGSYTPTNALLYVIIYYSKILILIHLKHSNMFRSLFRSPSGSS